MTRVTCAVQNIQNMACCYWTCAIPSVIPVGNGGLPSGKQRKPADGDKEAGVPEGSLQHRQRITTGSGDCVGAVNNRLSGGAVTGRSCAENSASANENGAKYPPRVNPPSICTVCVLAVGEPLFSGKLFFIRRVHRQTIDRSAQLWWSFPALLTWKLRTIREFLNHRSVNTTKHGAYLHAPSRVNSRRRSDKEETDTQSMSGKASTHKSTRLIRFTSFIVRCSMGSWVCPCAQSATVGGAESTNRAEDGEWVLHDGAPWDGREVSSRSRCQSITRVKVPCRARGTVCCGRAPDVLHFFQVPGCCSSQ